MSENRGDWCSEMEPLWCLEDLQSAVFQICGAENKTGAVARAYTLSQKLRTLCQDNDDPWSENVEMAFDAARNISFYLREMLIVSVTVENEGMLTDITFERALHIAFGGNLSVELHSQMHLGRNAICRIGRTREGFLESARRPYWLLSDQELDGVYRSYHFCSQRKPR